MSLAAGLDNLRNIPGAARRHASHDVRHQSFASAEEAWLWTMAALIARRDGARYTANKGAVTRPCDPDDVVKCLDTLYRRQRIDLAHARILRMWGERQSRPAQKWQRNGKIIGCGPKRSSAWSGHCG